MSFLWQLGSHWRRIPTLGLHRFEVIDETNPKKETLYRPEGSGSTSCEGDTESDDDEEEAQNQDAELVKLR